MAKLEDPKRRRLAKDKDMQSEEHEEILNWLFRNVEGLIGGDGSRVWKTSYVETLIYEACSKISGVVNKLNKGLQDYGKQERNYYNPCVPQSKQELNWLKKQIEFYSQFIDNPEKLKDYLGSVPNYPGVIVSDIKIQSPIYEKPPTNRQRTNQYEKKIAGFVDMEAEITVPKLIIVGITERFKKNTKKWIAPEIKYHISFRENSTTWYFDVRTSVGHLGSLLREIELLKNSLESCGTLLGIYAVVAPHTGNSITLLENQGIHVINFDSEIEFDKSVFPQKNKNDYSHVFGGEYESLSLPSFSMKESR